MPARADLNIYQGDDYAAEVAITNADGTPADLTSCVASAQIRLYPADRSPSVVVEITAMIGSSAVLLSIPSDETEKLVREQYVWDLQLTFPDSIVTVLNGKVNVTLEVTRP